METAQTIDDVLKQLVTEKGQDILRQPRLVSAYLADLVSGSEKQKRFMKIALLNGVGDTFLKQLEETGFQNTTDIKKFKGKVRALGFGDDLVDSVSDTLLYAFSSTLVISPESLNNEIGVLGDAEKSLYWYRKAAIGGKADSQFKLACLYDSDGDVAEAIKWFRKAAQQQHELAEKRLSYFSETEQKAVAAHNVKELLTQLAEAGINPIQIEYLAATEKINQQILESCSESDIEEWDNLFDIELSDFWVEIVKVLHAIEKQLPIGVNYWKIHPEEVAKKLLKTFSTTDLELFENIASINRVNPFLWLKAHIPNYDEVIALENNFGKSVSAKVLPWQEVSKVTEEKSFAKDTPKIYPDGKYIGDFLDGKRHGKGKFIFSDGSYWEGDWKDDAFTGQGRYIANHTQYEGQFLNGKYHGHGRKVYVDGSIYEGNWYQGVRQGTGRLTFRDGNYYEGSFSNNKRHGRGSVYNELGTIIESGSWEYGKKISNRTDIKSSKQSSVAGKANAIEIKFKTRHFYQNKTYSDGRVYEGELKDGAPHGQGKMTWPNGSFYNGSWRNGQIDGHGEYHSTNDGTIYVGEFEENARYGKGKYTWPDGSYYNGDFVRGNFEGNGERYYAKDKCTYTGSWKNNRRNGQGKLVWSNGDVYEGDFLDNFRTGKGKYTWPDGSCYKGDFVKGKFEGYGERYYAKSKSTYTGLWKDNKQNGQGKSVWESGSVYEGDFLDDSRTGKGKYTWSNGDIYEGDFLDNFRTGEGKYTWLDGSYYKGDFVKGNFEGYGERYYAKDKCTYIGPWKNGKRHGLGKLVWERGAIYEGDFLDDYMTGKGMKTWPGGSYYKGDFVNGNFEGSGEFYVAENGATLTGKWKNNQQIGKTEESLQSPSSPASLSQNSPCHCGSGKKYKNCHGIEPLPISSSHSKVTKIYKAGKYVGEMKHDKRHGRGRFEFNNDYKLLYYDGDWYNDERTGHGEITWKDGSRYIGNVFAGLPHGRGKLIDKDGHVKEGKFNYGIFEG